PLQPGKPARHIAFLPAAHCALALAHRPNDRHLADPISRQQHNPRSPDQLLRRITGPPPNPPVSPDPQETARCMPASSCPQTRTILVIWESSVSARTLVVSG